MDTFGRNSTVESFKRLILSMKKYGKIVSLQRSTQLLEAIISNIRVEGKIWKNQISSNHQPGFLMIKIVISKFLSSNNPLLQTSNISNSNTFSILTK